VVELPREPGADLRFQWQDRIRVRVVVVALVARLYRDGRDAAVEPGGEVEGGGELGPGEVDRIGPPGDEVLGGQNDRGARVREVGSHGDVRCRRGLVAPAVGPQRGGTSGEGSEGGGEDQARRHGGGVLSVYGRAGGERSKAGTGKLPSGAPAGREETPPR